MIQWIEYPIHPYVQNLYMRHVGGSKVEEGRNGRTDLPFSSTSGFLCPQTIHSIGCTGTINQSFHDPLSTLLIVSICLPLVNVSIRGSNLTCLCTFCGQEVDSIVSFVYCSSHDYDLQSHWLLSRRLSVSSVEKY